MKQKKTWCVIPGGYSHTCGYTGPGMGLVIILFEYYKIHDFTGFEKWLGVQNISFDIFAKIVNETIGNLLDLAPYCPISGCQNGLQGLINGSMDGSIKPPVSKIVREKLMGINIISFGCLINNQWQTFHHSAIYVNGQDCFVIDSWFDNHTKDSRPVIIRHHPTYRVLHFFSVLYDYINNKNQMNKELISSYFKQIFLAPLHIYSVDLYLVNNTDIAAFVFDNNALNLIWNKAFLDMHAPTNFGGKRNKRAKKYSKIKRVLSTLSNTKRRVALTTKKSNLNRKNKNITKRI